MISRHHLLTPTVVLLVAGALTACGSEPATVASAPTVTVTIDPTGTTTSPGTPDTADGATAPTTGGATAPTTGGAPAAVPVTGGADVQAFIDALDAMVAYTQANPGNLHDDAQFRTLKQEFVRAKRAINRTDLWLGENSAVTGNGLAVSAGEALSIGQAAVRPNATVRQIELHNDDAALTWEIEFSNGDDVDVDAATGVVTDIDLDD